MDTDQLRYFLCIAETGNFTRAAEQLSISQSALSRSIQRLEEELGQPLFDRKPRTVEPTDAGVRFQTQAIRILSIIDDVKTEISDDGETGRIRLGAIPTVAPYFLPALLQRFSTRFPRAILVVQEDTTDNLIKSCKHGELDLAVLALPVPARYLEVEELCSEELLLMLPPQHALVKKKRIQIADVEPYPFVLLDEAHCLSDNINSFCRQRSFQPVVVERTSQLVMVQELVSLSHGVSMIPAMARKFDRSKRRVYRSFYGLKPRRTIVAVWNAYRYQSRLLSEFRESLSVYASSFGTGADSGPL